MGKQAAEAGRKKAKAKAAEAAAEKSNKLSVEEQKNADELAKAADAKDAAMAECATDGSECQEGNKCKKIDNSKGPYMAADGFSCSKVKQSWVGDEDESGGLAWAGIDQEAAPLEPLKAADPKKCDALTKGAKGLFKAAITSKTSCPLLTAAHATKVTFKDRRHAMLSVFDWTAACKPWCYPGTATKTADGVQDTWGICLDAADVMQAKQQITSMPSYKASGRVADSQLDRRVTFAKWQRCSCAGLLPVRTSHSANKFTLYLLRKEISTPFLKKRHGYYLA